jgi:hypothetical protein
LQRELTAKERAIATLQATNKLHKQQLQQLAQSAAQAGLQVTPQHLLHIASAADDIAAASYDAAALPQQGAAVGDLKQAPATKAVAQRTASPSAAYAASASPEMLPAGRAKRLL